jgi:hypothetical protein
LNDGMNALGIRGAGKVCGSAGFSSSCSGILPDL